MDKKILEDYEASLEQVSEVVTIYGSNGYKQFEDYLLKTKEQETERALMKVDKMEDLKYIQGKLALIDSVLIWFKSHKDKVTELEEKIAELKQG